MSVKPRNMAFAQSRHDGESLPVVNSLRVVVCLVQPGLLGTYVSHGFLAEVGDS